jgi:hypothetical protein
MLVEAGFEDVRVEEKEESKEFIKDWMPGSGAENHVVSANVTARKPAAADRSSAGGSGSTLASSALAGVVTSAFARAAGTSVKAAGPVGRAVAELVDAFAAVARAIGEHHARHAADAADEDSEGEDEPEPAEEKKAGC